jgi:hypothetical protein
MLILQASSTLADNSWRLIQTFKDDELAKAISVGESEASTSKYSKCTFRIKQSDQILWYFPEKPLVAPFRFVIQDTENPANILVVNFGLFKPEFTDLRLHQALLAFGQRILGRGHRNPKLIINRQ